MITYIPRVRLSGGGSKVMMLSRSRGLPGFWQSSEAGSRMLTTLPMLISIENQLLEICKAGQDNTNIFLGVKRDPIEES